MFEVNEEKIRDLYHRAWIESGMNQVNPRKYPYLDRALTAYARQNGCSYDQAYRTVRTVV